KSFDAQFACHEQAVLKVYGDERQRVLDANPGRERAAETALSGIVTRVQTSLRAMRGETDALFR
ncbi:MAG TPA: hypothetical protein VFZ01_10135, partial [Geminicoccaceae bacterium]